MTGSFWLSSIKVPIFCEIWNKSDFKFRGLGKKKLKGGLADQGWNSIPVPKKVQFHLDVTSPVGGGHAIHLHETQPPVQGKGRSQYAVAFQKKFLGAQGSRLFDYVKDQGLADSHSTKVFPNPHLGEFKVIAFQMTGYQGTDPDHLPVQQGHGDIAARVQDVFLGIAQGPMVHFLHFEVLDYPSLVQALERIFMGI